MLGQLLKYCEKSSAFRVALIIIIFRSVLFAIRSFRTSSRKSLWDRSRVTVRLGMCCYVYVCFPQTSLPSVHGPHPRSHVWCPRAQSRPLTCAKGCRWCRTSAWCWRTAHKKTYTDIKTFFSKNAFNCLKVTVRAFIMFHISNKSFDLSILQIILKKYHHFQK